MRYAPENHEFVLLLIAASPDRVVQLRSDREVRQIQERLLTTRHGRAMVVHTRWAVRPDDLMQAILELRPRVVHFSGHGTAAEGILLEDVAGAAQPVSGSALADLFAVLRDQIRLVVLNACDTQSHAEAISRHIDVAIGMRHPIQDSSAIEFASAFYQAIASGFPLSDAFELARSALRIKGLPGAEIPELFSRPGVDPSRTILFDTTKNGHFTGGSAAEDAWSRDAPARRTHGPVERLLDATAGGPTDLLGTTAGLLAAACPDEASFAGLLSGAGVSPARIPALRSLQARYECLLLELAQAGSPDGLELLATELSRLDPPRPAAAAAVRRLAVASSDGWPDSLDSLWLALCRRGDGWMLEFRAPRFGRGGTVGSARSARVPVASETVVQVEVREAGVTLRVQADVASPLIGLKARVWTGITSLSKQLIPWFDERLGPAAGEELTLLEATTTWRELDAA